jgi:hypothetical protein
LSLTFVGSDRTRLEAEALAGFDCIAVVQNTVSPLKCGTW